MAQFTFTDPRQEGEIREIIEESSRDFFVPQKLKNQQNWLTWKLEQRGERTTKVPYSVKGHYQAGTQSPDEWGTYTEATERVADSRNKRPQNPITGVGFVFNGTDIVGVDLDNCRDADTGETEDWAVEVIETLDSFTTISTSGTGFHVYVASDEGLNDSLQNRHGDVEMYDSDSPRFFTFSGRHVEDTPTNIESRTEEVLSVQSQKMPEASDDVSTEKTETGPDGSDIDFTSYETDLTPEQVVQTATKYSDKFESLHNDTKSFNNGDTSRDDLSYFRQLSFWAQEDERLMEQIYYEYSERTRPKSDRTDYVERTIATAVQSNDETFSGSYVD